jgi:hypothetical protein
MRMDTNMKKNSPTAYRHDRPASSSCSDCREHLHVPNIRFVWDDAQWVLRECMETFFIIVGYQ